MNDYADGLRKDFAMFIAGDGSNYNGPTNGNNAGGTGGPQGAGNSGGPVGAPQSTNNDGQGQVQQGAGDNRTFDQAAVDRIVADRLAREKAKFADYEDVKAKAARYDEYQASQQTDLEKLQGQYEELLGKTSRTEQELRITRAASKHGLSAEAAAFLHGETDEEVDAAAAKLAALTATNAAGTGGGTNNNGDGNGDNAGGRRPVPSQGHGSSGDGASSVAAGRERFRSRYGKTT